MISDGLRTLERVSLWRVVPLWISASLAGRVRHGLQNWRARIEAVALGVALQWCLVLAAWGLLPLMLWR